MVDIAGDEDLGRRTGERLGARHPVFVVAEVVGSAVRTAARGVALDADVEIGSISKAFTGLLYRDSVARGEVGPDTTLGTVLDLGESALAGITLASLSTHTSGLPRLAPVPDALRRSWELWRHGRNPYREDLATLLAQAQGVSVGRHRARYSNLGFQLLGHAIAGAAGTRYAELVAARLCAPLGLTATSVPAGPAELRPTAIRGRNRHGREMEPWTGAAVGPAGGIRSCVTDLARIMSALVDGSAPGLGALDPVTNFSGRGARIGAGWMILTTPYGEVTWHNGGTGGFRSWLGIHRDRAVGVAIVSATAIGVDRPASEQLRDLVVG
jgi:CubicO group peptidase (beta-lactamase class C family)